MAHFLCNVGMPARPRGDCKVCSSARRVQLIVFVAAIREILKKEIYGWDKRCFWLVKTKDESGGLRLGVQRITNESHSICE
jgi:hypothetical protein